MSPRKASFAPLADEGTRVLVLGSLPGERSLAEQRYYAHPRNLFWRLIAGVTGEDLPGMPYADRLVRLKLAGIGLWDVVGSGRRKGSLDAAIRDAVANPLRDFSQNLPQLRAIAFNGQKAAKLGTALLHDAPQKLLTLPSSSPAYAAMPFAEKQNHWLQLREFLETPGQQSH